MAASLAAGFRLVGDPEDADVVVVNTCSFIREATSMDSSARCPRPTPS
jgi:tRNA A37 methylthiotransferase MiaB